MTDDLKERLRERQATAGFYSPKPGVIRAVYRDDTLTTEALAYITDLEARLAAAVEVQDRLMSERYQHYLRAEAAEAGEDALAEALRSYRADLCEGFCLEAEWSDEAHNHPEIQRDCGGCLAAAALAAYGARRGQ